MNINPLNAELKPICHLLALLGAHPVFHVSRIRVKKDYLIFILQTLSNALCVISGFGREVAEHCALLDYYPASSRNFLPTFRDKLSVPYSGFKSVVLSYLAAEVWNNAQFMSFGRLLYVTSLDSKDFELRKDSWTLRIGPINCLETSVRNYYYSLRNLQCSDGLSNKVSNIIRRLMDNIKLLLICILRVLLSQYFFIKAYMVLFLFNNVIYVFLLYDYVLSLYVYVSLPWLRVFCAFSSVVRQMPG